ncbi:MAG: ABC transporter ATP-binding protein [Acidimicrobiia bacterium]|nr:ABC transporter ATP-binding protein [Acidimicrobiia bacterium]
MNTSPETSSGRPAKVQISGVQKYFRWEKKGVRQELLALDGVDLDLKEGEFVSVIGPSGCGKTTLLRIVAGLLPFDGGEVRIDGTPVTGPGRERAMVFQSFGLFPWKTVLDNVKMPLVIRKADPRVADQLSREFITKVGLAGFEDAMPHQLSGGMQQRVGLARALVTDPEILLMDEPFGAIDAQTRELMQEELMKLWSNSGKTVMFVTHDLDEAVALADRVVVLTRGPGRIRASIDVDLPRPRWDYDLRAEKGFIEARQEIWQMLREDLEYQRSQLAVG